MLDKIFSIKNSPDGSRKIICFLGIKLKIKTVDIAIKDYFSSTIAREIYSANEVRELHSKVFPQFKDINEGKNIAVFGSGPTLQYYNNELNSVNIALNDTLSLKNINFDYSFALDANILHDWPTYLEDIKAMKCVNFIGNPLNVNEKQFPEIANSEKYGIYRYYSSNRSKCYAVDFGKIFFKDLNVRPLLDAYSVCFSALQFALWTHPQNLYLIGLDTCNNGHFFGQTYHYLTEHMIEIYKKFKQFTELHYPDVKIISVNPIGLKGLFKDVYTQSYVDEHPELLKEDIEIIK